MFQTERLFGDRCKALSSKAPRLTLTLANFNTNIFSVAIMSSSSWAPIAKVYDPLKAGSIDGTDEDPHDRGVVRAMNATYKPNPHNLKGKPDHTLFVARLAPSVTEEKLTQEFKEFGTIKHIRLVRDIVTGFSKGYAFIEFEDEKSTMIAQRAMNKKVIDEHEIFVDFECTRTLPGWIPRRLGGGFGGKKESGQLRFGGRDRPFRKPLVVQDHLKRSDDRRDRYLNESRDRHSNYGHRGYSKKSRDYDRDRRHYKSRSRSRDRDYDRDRRHYKSRSRSRSRDKDYSRK